MANTHGSARTTEAGVFPRWSSPPDAARYAGVSRRLLDIWILDGRLRAYKGPGGRLVFINLNELDELIMSSTKIPS